MNAPKCIIFDCDGVLVDSETIANQVLLEMAQPLGLKMTLAEAKSLFNGRKLKVCFTMIEERIGASLPEGFEKDYRALSYERFSKEMVPIQGVKDFIDKLSIPYCVASSGPVDKIRLNLTITGLIDKFEHKIFSSYQINSWKPDPGIFLHAAREMGFAVEECVVIEDSLAGVQAGVAGGFKVYGLATELTAQELRGEGAVVFYNYQELDAILFN